jgi:hypothetical protein
LNEASQPVGEPVEVFIGPAKQPSRAELIAQAKWKAAAPTKIAVKSVPVVTGSTNKTVSPTKIAAAGPWTSLTPTPLANASVPAMAAALAEPTAGVPLPRPRPANISRKR